MRQRINIIGGIFGLFSVVLGAFGAHALKTQLPVEMLSVWQTAVQYQVIHALLLIYLGLALRHAAETKWLTGSAWAATVGVVLFSGSLYALVLTGIKTLGMITPIGGLCFIIAWGLVIVHFTQEK